jgi:aerobic carbon-monoxide dehydrogenase large subunit
MTAFNSFVGRPIERVEDLRLLRGRGQFVDDIERDGQLHAVMLRSSVAHGRIRSIDVSAARALPGVAAVITAADLGDRVPTIPLRLAPHASLTPFEQPVIAWDKVRYVGEPIAVVLAETPDIAEDALDLILVDIEALPAVVDTARAASGDSLLFEASGSNLAVTYTAELGDARAAFEGAYVRRERFDTQRHTAATMETRGLLAEWDAENSRLIVFGAAKVPFATRRILAGQMQLSEDAIDMIEVDVGGGFGMRGEFYPEDFLVPFAARHINRPVKWIEDRREHLQASNHAREFDGEIELVCDRNGRILALRGHVNANIGAYMRANATIAPRNIGQFMSGPYRIPNIHLEVAALLTNKTPTGTYRGPGRFEADFFRERLFDIVAQDLGIDPIEFRRRNLLTQDELPSKLPTVSPVVKEEELDSGDYHHTLDLCLREIGWDAKAHLQGRLIDGRYHGLSVACFIEGGAAGPRENARMVLDDDGGVSVYVGSAIVGQGLETVCSQIAADALEIGMDRIRIYHGSTIYLKEGFGSFHSRSTVMGGAAIMVAAENFKLALKGSAGRRLNCAPGDIVLEDGLARAPNGNTVTWAAVAPEKISAEGTFSNHKHTYSYGAQAVHLAVDAKTGHVEILDLVTVEDVGRVVNPLTLRGQVIGAVVQGLGGVFLEHLVYDDDGQLLTGSFADYLLPTATDYPNIRAVVLGLHPSPITPLGAKGAGEGGVIPVGGVVANAIAAALRDFGVQPCSLPLSPSRLWGLINDAAGEAVPA